MAVVGHDDGDNGDAGLHGQVEGALLVGQQRGLLGVAAGALGEHVDALALGLDLGGGAVHGGAGVFAVLAVDEDCAAEAHEPAEEGHLLELGLCRDAAVLGEDGAQHEHVELGLVVADEDGGPGGVEDVVRVVNDELDARGQLHGVVEGSRDGPLRNLLLAQDGQDDGGDDAVERAGDERHVGGQDAGHEGRLGDDKGQHVEGDCQGCVADEELGDEAKEEDHGLSCRCS